LTKVNRACIWQRTGRWEYHEAIECAVRSDGTSPALEFLDALEAGEWDADPEHVPPEDEEQIHDYEMMLAKIDHIGVEGCPDTGTSVNYLNDGIWEIKHGRRRLSYWDTPGDGTFSPKEKVDDRRTIIGPEHCIFWWYPKMDQILRLGCAWPKVGQLAPVLSIADAKAIREEDCAHDRTEPGAAEIDSGGP
jgi:hypothetical protein